MIISIIGSMGSGKSKQLIDHYNRYGVFGHSLVYKPKIDSRTPNFIVSRNGQSIQAKEISSFTEIVTELSIKKDIKYIYIDEIQFLGYTGLKEFFILCEKRDILVLASGLDLTSELDVFSTTSKVLCYSSSIIKLGSQCSCGSHEKASFTECIIEKKDDVLIGGDDIYKSSCRKCHKLIK